MNILHLTEYDNVGAGRSGLRLHEGLINANINSTFLVAGKSSDTKSVVTPNHNVKLYKLLQSKFSETVLKRLYGSSTTFSVNLTPSLLLKQIKSKNPDIVNLHWIGRDFFKIEEFQDLNLPIVWTLHDMWAFTGGCHYTEDCDRFTKNCGACPQLGQSQESDLTRWTWKRKVKAWKNLNLTIVSPSVWLANSAKASSLFKNLRIEVIPYGLDTNVYRPISKQVARELLNLPQDKKLILFGALSATTDKRKGFHLLLPALKYLSQAGWNDSLELVIFGASQPDKPLDLDFHTHYLGRLNDNLSLALIYSAADIFVLPSLQDNLPNTVMEALACGTPCVAFDVGGTPDMIEHQQNGYLAEPYEIEDLATGIAWVLQDKERHQKLRFYAREKAEKAFSLEIQARRYLSLYTEILASK